MSFDSHRRKGSHGILYFGNRLTTVPDRNDIRIGLLKAMARDLGLEDEFRRMETMRFEFDLDIAAQGDGSYLVTFPQVRGAVKDEATMEQARDMAADCLIAALGGYMKLGQPIPARGSGKHTIAVSPVQAAKLALYAAMRIQRVSKVEMGRRLGISEAAVRRLLDLDHRSHIDLVDRALEALGKRIVLDVQAA